MPDAAPSWVKTETAPSWVKSAATTSAPATPDIGSDYNPYAASQGDPNLSLKDVGELGKGAAETATFGLASPLFNKPEDKREAGYRTLGSVLGMATPYGLGKAAIGAGVRAVTRGVTRAGQKIGELSKSLESGDIGRSVLTPSQGAAAAEESGQSIASAADRFAAQQEREAGTTATKQALSGEKSAFLENQATKRTQRKAANAIDNEITRAESEADGRLDASARGERMQADIKNEADRLAKARADTADKAYTEADASMAQRIENADYWQTSPSGQRFLAELRNSIESRGMTTETSATRSDLSKILQDLEGVESETDIAFSDGKVLRETLRRLRDRASGHPATGFDAIEQQRAGSLAAKLAKSLEEWDPKLAQADKAYKDMSERLKPTLTKRGKAVLKREKFDYDKLAGDPQTVPNTFFKSEQGIDQLTELLGGDSAKVEQYAYHHALDELRGKSPAQAEQWLSGQRSWLNRDTLPKTYARVTALVSKAKYAAQRAETATGQATKAAKRGLALRKQLRTDLTSTEDLAKAATKGPQAQAFDAARERIENVQRNWINKGIKPENLAGEIRNMLNNPSVSRVVPKDVAQQINAQIDEIARLEGREKKIKHIGEVLLKWGVLYPTLGYEAARLTGVFH